MGNWLGIEVSQPVAVTQEDYEGARTYANESIALFCEQGDRRQLAMPFYAMGLSFQATDDNATARGWFSNALSELYELKDKMLSSRCLEALAGLTVAEGGYERAANLFGAAEALRQNHQVPYQRAVYERNVSTVRAHLDDTRFAKAWAEGRAMPLERAIEYALEPPVPREQVAHPKTARKTVKNEFSGLTEHEREVAAHIAQGESNREIAEALVVTERTVESHVTNILNKLGFTSRTQIRKWVNEKGLVNNSKRDLLMR